MIAKIKIFCVVAMLFFGNAQAESLKEAFFRIRELPDAERILEFKKLSNEEKLEIFFLANQRMPPYLGFFDAMAHENVEFLSKLRDALDTRARRTGAGLSYVSTVRLAQRRGTIAQGDLEKLRLGNICTLSVGTECCLVLVTEITSAGSGQ